MGSSKDSLIEELGIFKGDSVCRFTSYPQNFLEHLKKHSAILKYILIYTFFKIRKWFMRK